MKNYLTAASLAAALVMATACLSRAQSLSTAESSVNSSVVPQGATLVVELAKSIDAKKARSGDPVKAEVVQDVIANGHIVIPQGSHLLGHITEAKPLNSATEPCVLGVVFDHVALKHGDKLSLNAVMEALAPPVPEPDPLGSSSYGGSKGSGSQPISGHNPGWITDPRDRIDHSRGTALSKAGDPSTYGSPNNSLQNGHLGSGNRGVFGMPGVSLKLGAPAPELVSAKADIKLESGTQMVLGVTGR